MKDLPHGSKTEFSAGVKEAGITEYQWASMANNESIYLPKIWQSQSSKSILLSCADMSNTATLNKMQRVMRKRGVAVCS